MKLFSKGKKTTLHLCTNNLYRFYTDEQLERLEDFAEENRININEMECLSHCEECALQPYAFINKKYVEADSVENLIKKIADYTESERAQKK